MNPVVTFPRPAPELKLPRASITKNSAFVAEERHRLEEDQEAFRAREANLREYESRLRLWQQEMEAVRATSVAGGSGLPVGLPPARLDAGGTAGESTLQAGWHKLHRAREILDAEHAHLRDDRLVLRAREAALKDREDALAAREARLLAREEQLAAAAAQPQAVTAAAAPPAPRATRSPFEVARSLFGGKD